MSDIGERWAHGRLTTLLGLGLLAVGSIAYMVTDPFDTDADGSVRPLSFWPFAVVYVGALLMGWGSIYLASTECPACHVPLGNHLAKAGIFSRSVPIRYCPKCGSDILTDES